MHAPWNGWGSSGLSARCPRARGKTEKETARETRSGSADTPPPQPTGGRWRDPAAFPLRNPTAPVRRYRPSTMTPRECCSEAEPRRWSTRKVPNTAGQVSKSKYWLIIVEGFIDVTKASMAKYITSTFSLLSVSASKNCLKLNLTISRV